ncbi:MAG: asparagine synthase-related protein, partial [Kiritimatiellae bacterium]|nr:asparagine synthase-related protein [Kiritimatiellia bacterium]
QGAPCFEASSDHGIAMTCPGIEARIGIIGRARFQCDPRRRVAVVLHGHLWGTGAAHDLTEAYARDGIAFVRQLEGSFAVLVADGERGQVWLATDRVNSRRVCLREREGAVEVATELSHFAAEDATVDPTGIAWVLCCGVAHDDRTILDGVRRMRRAAWQRFDADGGGPVETYWCPRFTDDDTRCNRADAKRELSELLVASVRRCDPGEQPLHISLSVGYDVAGIAGLLARGPRHDAIRTFSYGLDEERVGSDAWAAREMAARHGFVHRFYPSHDGRTLAAIERNASWGDGQAQFCDESLAWWRLREELGDRLPWLFVGEQCFGGTEMTTPGEEDLLRVCGIRRLRAQPWLKRVFSASAFERAAGEQNADIASILRRALPVGTIHDARVFVFLDQRVANQLMPWRERYAGRVFRVVSPWLSHALLDFIGRIPHAWRTEKKLYKETIADLLPEVFSRGRAVLSGYVPDWQMELWRERGKIGEARMPRSAYSPLDSCIDPDAVRGLFARCAPTFDARQPRWRQITRDRLRFAACTRLGLPSALRGPTDAERTAFLLRYLTMRRFLELAREHGRVNVADAPRGAGRP